MLLTILQVSNLDWFGSSSSDFQVGLAQESAIHLVGPLGLACS